MSASQTDLLDTLRAVETPEGITLDLPVAGPVVRALAWLIDTLIKYGTLWLLFLILIMLGTAGFGLWLIAIFLLEWFYPVVFEVYFNGATPGKRALGLRVVNDNGTPVDFSASLIRNLLRVADFMPLMYGFGLLSMLLNRDFKRLGDLAAGTIVIYRERSEEPAPLPEGEAKPLNITLDAAEQRLLLNFAERSSSLNPQRQAELANTVQTLTGAAKDSAAGPETLLSYARWLKGSRL